MAAMSALVIIENLLRTNLPKFSFKEPVESFAGQDGDGHAALFVNYTAAGYASNDVAAFVRFVAGTESMPSTMVTQSHAAGIVIEGSRYAEIIMESPASWTSRHAELAFRLQFILNTTYSCPTVLRFAPNGGPLPELKGIMGSVATSLPADELDFPVVDRGYVGGGV